MAHPSYLTIQGRQQGLLSAGCSGFESLGRQCQPGREDEILVHSVSHKMSNTQKRTHEPLTLCKGIDKSSPLLNMALNSGETLQCVLKLYRFNATGTPEHYYSIELTDAKVIGIELVVPDGKFYGDATPFECVSFQYRAIKWQHHIAGTSGLDAWMDGASSSHLVPSPPVKAPVKLPNYLTGESSQSEFVPNYPAAQSAITWDYSQQENQDLALFTYDEGVEYLAMTQAETYDELSSWKSYLGLAMGAKDAAAVAKELRGFGAIAKVVVMGGVSYILVENYKPSYLDMGLSKWVESNPQRLKMGYGLNTFEGNLRVFKGNVFVELVFSGAVNAIDYLLNDEITLGEVVGRFSADMVKGIAAAAIAQGAGGLAVILGAPTAVAIGGIAVLAFLIGNYFNKADEKYQYTQPMQDKIQGLIDNEK